MRQAALSHLSEADPVLARAIETIGTPVVRRRPGGYQGLFRIIVEQQLSVPSARAILARCEARFGAPTPRHVLAASEEELRAAGLSRPKIRYLRAAAEAVLAGTLDLPALETLSDEEARAALTAVTGIGPWTAAIYLLFCEGREDIWPHGDVALLAAYAAASGFTKKPPLRQFDAASSRYAPYRGTAAHVLWTYYAHLKGRQPG
ncbi:DNA-3-methyladenine glycosylase family protein [Parvularcula oceani]|uniref:DNA-3-methyladenine glycosylase family protein n=1 Tax=Parvularcula oceani TaxID=1247963 RepID=UPI0004E1522D|nr:DNA-3-methyladenine glycosylase [Parvularcula oceani]